MNQTSAPETKPEDPYAAHRHDPPNHCGHALSGNGTNQGWSVEARMAYVAPQIVAGTLLDDRWRTIQYTEAVRGVPRAAEYSAPIFKLCGLYDYAAAQALRWWFVAEAQRDHQHLCLETRLISHRIEYSYTHTAEKAHDCIDGRAQHRPASTYGE